MPIWFVTFATYRRRPVFAADELRERCAAALKETCTRNGYRVYALAVMPDHVHVLVDTGESKHNRSKLLNNLKGVSARRVFQAAPDLKFDLRSEHLWADEYQALPVTGATTFRRARLYIEQNPEKVGLPRQVYDWREHPAFEQ